MCVNLTEVIGDVFMRNVPLAIIARRNIGKTPGTEEWTAVEELFKALLVRDRGSFECQRQGDEGLALAAGVFVFRLNHWLVVVVNPTRYDTRTGAKRARH